MKMSFEKIQTKRTKRAVCNVCGKRYQRSETFYQTINPFNTNEDGTPKNREQIIKEINIRAKIWMKEKIENHCEENKNVPKKEN